VADKNVIQKQSLQFRYNGTADGFALQKEVSDWCKLVLIPEIEQQLEAFAPADDYISIDKLVIDASIDKKDWQQQIRNELIRGLSKKLSAYKPLPKSTAVKTERLSRKLDELVLFYFENGFLPWWGKAMLQPDLRSILLEWTTSEMPQVRAAEIAAALKQIISPAVVERMMNHLPQQIYFQFLRNIFRSETEFVNQVALFLKELMPAETTTAKRAAVERPVHGFILNTMIKNAGKLDTALLFQFIYEELKTNKVTAAIVKTAAGKTGRPADPLKKDWQKFLAKEKKAAKKQITDPDKETGKLKYNKTIDELKGENTNQKQREELAAIVPEGIYIENAGAVIIAAFLPALFEKLKITSNQNILNTNLAAMIIQYAVSGNTKMEEHELVLPKILCGIDLELTVDTSKKITADQMQEADDMLSAVIEYWTVIKNTSLQGLRESFLQRSGKLSQVGNEWLLQVEQKPFDMLLQQLPWSISMIRLPWMNNLLKTEWV